MRQFTHAVVEKISAVLKLQMDQFTCLRTLKSGYGNGGAGKKSRISLQKMPHITEVEKSRKLMTEVSMGKGCS